MDLLAGEIVQRAYALNPAELDATLRSLGLTNWLQATQNLSFQGWDTGGGCMMLTADLPGTGGHQIGITNGEADFPRDTENFWVGVMDPDGDEVFYMFVNNGQLQNGAVHDASHIDAV